MHREPNAFGGPVPVAIGSSALIVSLTTAVGLLGALATGGVTWNEPLLLSAFVFVGSTIAPRPTMRSSARSIRTRFAASLFALACTVLASSSFTVPTAGSADAFVR